MQSAQRRHTIEDAIWGRAKLPVLGAIPHVAEAILPTLQTTLVPLSENPNADRAIEEMAAAMERHCDIDLIERLMASAKPFTVETRNRRPAKCNPIRIGVAFDDAFSSYYAENLELLEEAGAEIVPFSPLDERTIPRDVDALYFGGGMSEQHVAQLLGEPDAHRIAASCARVWDADLRRVRRDGAVCGFRADQRRRAVHDGGRRPDRHRDEFNCCHTGFARSV